MAALDLSIAISTARYGASRGELQRHVENVRAKREALFSETKTAKSHRHENISDMLYKLRKDGLVENDEDGWIITALGKTKLAMLKSKLPQKEYPKEPSDILIILMFDIPEKERRKRRWLRERLTGMGFRMVQKSVWSGKVKLPKKFIQDLKDLNILGHIDVFQATKLGSL